MQPKCGSFQQFGPNAKRQVSCFALVEFCYDPRGIYFKTKARHYACVINEEHGVTKKERRTKDDHKFKPAVQKDVLATIELNINC